MTTKLDVRKTSHMHVGCISIGILDVLVVY